jgi:xylulokinase
VIFVPHLGNGPPPEPDIHARGAFLGLSLTTTAAALYRATLEGVAMQSRMMLDGMVALEGVGAAGEVRMIGGTARNRLFLSIKANVLGRPLIVVEETEATALGAALLGGVAAGVYPSLQAAWLAIERYEYVVEPEPEAAERYEFLRTTVFAGAAAGLRSTNRSIAAFLGN